MRIPIDIAVEKPVKIRIRNYSSGKMSSFRYELQKVSWEEIKIHDNVDLAFNNFISTFNQLSDSIFTYKTINKSTKNQGWITKGIKVSCKNKQNMFQQKLRGDISSETYKNYYKILKKTISLAKKSFNEAFIRNAKNKCKASWQLISQTVNKNSNSSKKAKVNIQTSFNNQPLKNILDGFNSYFINACPDVGGNPRSNHVKTNNNCLFLEPTDPMEIYRIIVSMSNTESVGSDGIPVRLLKFTADLIAEPLI